MKDIKIIDDFFYKNCRTPTRREFIALGGNLRGVIAIYGNYINFLNEFGYDRPLKEVCRVVQVIDNRNKVIFEGTVGDVAREFGTQLSTVRRCIKEDWRYRSKYKVKYKEYDHETKNKR